MPGGAAPAASFKLGASLLKRCQATGPERPPLAVGQGNITSRRPLDQMLTSSPTRIARASL
jgi:hypothetical protein